MTTVTSHPRIRLRLPRLSGRRVAVLGFVVVILALTFVWVRQSSLVAVRDVRVTGLYGPDAVEVRQALVNEALTMTTLDVDAGTLASAVRGYPDIAGVTVSTRFPHGLVINVVDNVPLATVSDNGTQVAVTRSDALLRGRTVEPNTLPVVPLRYQPGGDTLVTPGSEAAVSVLAAAPYRFLSRVQSATWSAAHGVVLQLRNGPQLYFGGADQLARKWAAAFAVLASSSSAGAQYIDVTDPQEPAAGVNGAAATVTSAASGTATGSQ